MSSSSLAFDQDGLLCPPRSRSHISELPLDSDEYLTVKYELQMGLRAPKLDGFDNREVKVWRCAAPELEKKFYSTIKRCCAERQKRRNAILEKKMISQEQTVDDESVCVGSSPTASASSAAIPIDFGENYDVKTPTIELNKVQKQWCQSDKGKKNVVVGDKTNTKAENKSDPTEADHGDFLVVNAWVPVNWLTKANAITFGEDCLFARGFQGEKDVASPENTVKKKKKKEADSIADVETDQEEGTAYIPPFTHDNNVHETTSFSGPTFHVGDIPVNALLAQKLPDSNDERGVLDLVLVRLGVGRSCGPDFYGLDIETMAYDSLFTMVQGEDLGFTMNVGISAEDSSTTDQTTKSGALSCTATANSETGCNYAYQFTVKDLAQALPVYLVRLHNVPLAKTQPPDLEEISDKCMLAPRPLFAVNHRELRGGIGSKPCDNCHINMPTTYVPDLRCSICDDCNVKLFNEGKHFKTLSFLSLSL